MMIFSKLKYFLSLIFLYFILATILTQFYSKVELHQLLNTLNTPALDFFFKYYTHIGYGAVSLIFIPYVLYKKSLKNLLLGILNFLIAGLSVQFLKKIIIGDTLRPINFFTPKDLHLIEGVSLNYHYSFPSGHSATSIAFFLFLAYLFYKNKSLQILFAFMGILGAYSRVYLSQHFIEDTIAGGMLGVSAFFISYAIVNRINCDALQRRIFSPNKLKNKE